MAGDEEWNTVSVRGQNRAREIEVIRERYREHLAALQRLGANSPTERLANEYRRLQDEIQRAIAKLDEIDGTGVAPDPRIDTAVGRPPSRPATPSERGVEAAGASDRDMYSETTISGGGERATSGARVMLIALAGIAVLAILGFFVWRASGRSRQPDRVVDQRPAASETVREEQTATATATVAEQSLLKVAPASADFGIIRKGTRAVRQFEITNGGTATIPIRASRSTCKCLFYEYAGQVAPKKKETITVTVDGAKAKRGTLEETVQIASKNDQTMTASFAIHAVIK